MPQGADPNTEAGVRAWVDSIHPKFITMGLSDKLIAEDCDTVLAVTLLDEATLREEFDLGMGHAKLLLAAAHSVALRLGYAVSEPI